MRVLPLALALLLTPVAGFLPLLAVSMSPTGRTAEATTTSASSSSSSSAAAAAAAAADAAIDEATQQWDVDRYQSQHSFVWRYGSTLLDLVDWDLPVASILDVGCGSGELTRALRERAGPHCHVRGMDLDPSMVAAANKQIPQIDFFVGDVRSFRLSEPVDLLFSNAALHWIPPPDVPRAMESLGQALRPGGQLVVEFGGKGNVQTIVGAVRQVLKSRQHSVPPDFWFYPSIAEFANNLERHGKIEVTHASLYNRPTPLEGGPDGMANWLRMFGGKFWEGETPDEREQIIAEACELLRDKLYDESRLQWTADYRRIRVVGRKL